MLLAVAAALAGCGGDGDGGPKLAQRDAAPLIYLSNRIAKNAAADPCTARRDIVRLQAQAIRLVNSRRVPAPLKEDLLAGVNDLATHPVTCAPPPAPVTTAQEPSDHAKGKGKGHGKHGHKEKDD